MTFERHNYSEFACIGTGFSAIGLGSTLKRWYGKTDIRFFEKSAQLGGTWYNNQYPGCACDVPSALYSFSFEPNPNWSRILPPQREIWEYLHGVAAKYGLIDNMTFGVIVEKCEWIESKRRWRLHILHCKTNNVFYHECRFLFAAAGQLVTPRDLDIKGKSNFDGPIFHSANWRNDVDLTDKNVVLIGNGCTAAQIVPAIIGKPKRLTQIIRSKHWILPSIDSTYPTVLKRLFKYIPAAKVLERLIVFLVAENELRGFPMTKAGARFRQKRRAAAERYMKETAPEKYHDLLIPDFEIGCKRRIFDSGYLKSIHANNFEMTNEQAEEIVSNGMKTESKFIPADVVILANGYLTNTFLHNIEVHGRRNTLKEHWEMFGGAEAYNCSALNGFPNFFILLGPNAATGHTSAIMAAENSINYALRIISRVMASENGVAELKQRAEENYVDLIQTELEKTVWYSGCSSWYIKFNEEKGRLWNAMSYPYSQAHFWFRSVFPTWEDWSFEDAPVTLVSGLQQILLGLSVVVLGLLFGFFIV